MCDSCNANYIQMGKTGMNCHETGCPDAWKDSKLECKNCGTEFTPEESGQLFCGHVCYVNYWGVSCNCEECSQGYPDEEDKEDESDYQSTPEDFE